MQRTKMFALAVGIFFAIQGSAQASSIGYVTEDLLKVVAKVLITLFLAVAFVVSLWVGMGGGRGAEPDKIAMIFTIILMAFVLFGLPLLWAW